MPRPNKQDVTAQVRMPEAERTREVTQVVARPVDAPSVRSDPTLNSLVTGLTQFNTKLSNYLENQADRDLEDGMTARKTGAPKPEDKGGWFAHGYMVMDGQVKGMQDGTALQTAYDTEFDKEAGDIDGFIKKQWADRTKGLTDEAFMRGYGAEFERAASELRKKHTEYQRVQVLQKHESNGQFLIDQFVGSFAGRGTVPDTEALDTFKQQLKNQYGFSLSKVNEMMFITAKRLGEENGNFAIFEMFKKPNADGTPGAYYIPKFKEQIDAAQVQAQTRFLQKQNQAYEQMKRLREEKQESAMLAVYTQAIDGDADGARAALRRLVANGTISHGSDYLKYSEALVKLENRDMRKDEQVAMTGLLAGIYSGKVRVKDIIDSGLPPKEQRQLLTELRTKQVQDRTLALQAEANADRPFRSHAFKSQEDWIEVELKPIRSPLEPMKEEDLFREGARNQAKLEFTEWVSRNGVKDPETLRAKAVEIVERHKKRVEMFKTRQIDMAARNLRFTNEADVLKNADSMTTADLTLHLMYFEAQKKQPKAPQGANKDGKLK